MNTIEIRNRFNKKIIISGKYQSIKDCIEKNSGANLRDADLRGANLYDANLRGANLYDADLYGADLRDANLRGANLRDADLRGADLHGADLHGADLHGADLYDADLRGANLCGGVYIHIKGSSYDLYCVGNYIQIGCEKHNLKWWEKHGKELAEKENLTNDQIKEYKKYIAICKKLNKEK